MTAETVRGARPSVRPMLATVMLENAAFSAVSGAVLVAGATGLDSWLGVHAGVLVAVGAGLMVYAVQLFVWYRSPRGLRRGGRMAVAADVAWVLGAVALIAFTDTLTAAGELALAAVSVVVAGFAAAQSAGLSRLSQRGVTGQDLTE